MNSDMRAHPPAKKRTGWYLTPHTLFLASTLIYFSPYFVGSFQYIQANGRQIEHSYTAEVGVVVSFALAILVPLAYATRQRRHQIILTSASKVEGMVLLVLMFATGLYTLLSGQASITNKQLMLEQTNRLHLFFYEFCALGLVFAALAGYRKHRNLFVASLLGLLFIVYLGHRSALAIALIGIAYVRFHSSPIPKLSFKYSALAAGLFFAMAVYKSIYVAVKDQQWDMVADKLRPENLMQSAFSGMEQFTTFAHLDFVVSENFRLACSNIWLIPVSVIPFAEDMLGDSARVAECYYNSQVQPVFFAGYSGGVAANIWAEFFALFGYAGVPVLILVLSFFFWLLERLMRAVRSPILVAGLIIALINMSFYIQRKELFGAFISGKRALIAALAIFAVSWLLRNVVRERHGSGIA